MRCHPSHLRRLRSSCQGVAGLRLRMTSPSNLSPATPARCALGGTGEPVASGEAETGAEPDLEEIALHAPWTKGLIYCDMEGFAVEEDGTRILLDECGSPVYPPEGRFRVEWLP